MARMSNPEREARKAEIKALFVSDPEGFRDYSAGLNRREKIELVDLLDEILKEEKAHIKADLLAGAPVESGELAVYIDEHGELIITPRKNVQ
jgi:hypothetical protein